MCCLLMQYDSAFNVEIAWETLPNESTPLNKLAVADAAWARMPVDSLNMTLA